MNNLILLLLSLTLICLNNSFIFFNEEFSIYLSMLLFYIFVIYLLRKILVLLLFFDVKFIYVYFISLYLKIINLSNKVNFIKSSIYLNNYLNNFSSLIYSICNILKFYSYYEILKIFYITFKYIVENISIICSINYIIFILDYSNIRNKFDNLNLVEDN